MCKETIVLKTAVIGAANDVQTTRLKTLFFVHFRNETVDASLVKVFYKYCKLHRLHILKGTNYTTDLMNYILYVFNFKVVFIVR